MLTIDVPDDIAAPLTAEAERRGTTPQDLALTHLRGLLSDPAPSAKLLLDYLGSRLGSVTGTGEAFSQETGRRFADGLAEGRAARP